MYLRVKHIDIPKEIRGNSELLDDYLNLKIEEAINEIEGPAQIQNRSRDYRHANPPRIEEVSPGIRYRVSAYSQVPYQRNSKREDALKQALKGLCEGELGQVEHLHAKEPRDTKTKVPK